MKKHFLLTVFVLTVIIIASAQNPFAHLGYDVPIATSSKGEFEEFHGLTRMVEIGSVIYDTKTKKITGFVEQEKRKKEVSPVTTAMSIDPLCEKYYWISPYAFCLNNPVKYTDPTGMYIVGTDGKPVFYDSENGWSANASADIQKIGNAMMITPDGNKVLNDMMGTEYGITMNYKEGYSSDSNYKLGHALISRDGNTNEIIKVDINLYDQALKDNVATYEHINKSGSSTENLTESQKLLAEQVPTLTERIGQIGAHEGTHATNPQAMTHLVGRTKAEQRAVEVETKVIRQTPQYNRAIPVVIKPITIK